MGNLLGNSDLQMVKSPLLANSIVVPLIVTDVIVPWFYCVYPAKQRLLVPAVQPTRFVLAKQL